MISRREILAAGQHLLMSCFRCYEESRSRFLICIYRGKVKATLAQFVREGGLIFFSFLFYPFLSSLSSVFPGSSYKASESCSISRMLDTKADGSSTFRKWALLNR